MATRMVHCGVGCLSRGSAFSGLLHNSTGRQLMGTARLACGSYGPQRYISSRTGYQSNQMTIKSVRTSKTWKNKKASLVIFDKDGTLICFHSMWYPWLKKISSKLCEVTGLDLEQKVSDLIGYCNVNNKFNPGLLAESTKPIIQAELTKLLQSEGYDVDKAQHIVQDVWEEGDSSSAETLKEIINIKMLFKILKDNQVKIAISTSDSREGTSLTLKELGLEKYVDHIMCGDDPNMEPKPSPFSALRICEQLNVDPADTVMVGDTKADVGMGKAAKLGWNVGVLSGVGNSGDLLPEADHVIHSVTDLLPLILPGTKWQQYYKYRSAERVMVEGYEPDDAGPTQDGNRRAIKNDIRLAILDLHGTLMCTHSRYMEWLEHLCKRMEQITGLQLSAIVYQQLGVNNEDKKLEQGLLAEGTSSQVKSKLAEILLREGLTYEESNLIVNQTWKECGPLLEANPKLLDKNSKELFKTLKYNNMKIAICTGDTRESALSDLDELGLLKYVDMMVCGDDLHSQPKPSAHNALLICNEFKIHPDQTVVIGDSIQDIKMAIDAKVSTTIGVLTGVGNKETLTKHADHVVAKVGDVMSHLFEPNNPIITGVRSFSTMSGTNSLTSKRYFSSSMRHKAKDAEKIKSYDYVIVGAGSAGCVLANRLSEDKSNTVLLVEAGPKAYMSWDWWKICMPAALMYNLCDNKYNWYYHTEPEKGMNNREMYWPRGRVWGGSSALNAMVYVRGHAYDYDRWEREGATGWSYADCLPYFRKSQGHELGADDYRGGDGPFKTSRGKSNNPLHEAFIEAGQQAGYPFTDDMNGYQQEGVGYMDMSIDSGQRSSSATAYLYPSLRRSNLETKVNFLTSRVLFNNNKAEGIEIFDSRYSREFTEQIRANKEVILCGGAINSPQLLMLSGVGNADHLRDLNIPVVAHIPGVGQNLQDHLEMYIQQRCSQPVTLYTSQWKFPHNMVKIGLEWLLFRTGKGATSHLESGGFIRSRPGVEHPDLQFHFLPSVVSDHGRKTGSCHAYQVHVGPMRPTSTGHVSLKSRDPKVHPKIVANYLTTEGDMQEMRDSITLAREIFAQKAFDEFRGPELQPGIDVQSKSQMDEFIRSVADSAYHPSCTCKMGQPTDPMAVVDPETKVIGVEGLRVVDASIMPSVVSGNLNAPTIMIAEKAADIILGKDPLPRSVAPVYEPKTLETQR